MADGGSGALPNSASSVSVHPLKHTAYPPNGARFGAFGLPFALAFAIVSLSSSVVGMIVSLPCVPQGHSDEAGHGGDRPRGLPRPQGTQINGQPASGAPPPTSGRPPAPPPASPAMSPDTAHTRTELA
jgi:hypothetical protein